MSSQRYVSMVFCVCFFGALLVLVEGDRKLSIQEFPCQQPVCTHNSSIIWVKAKATNSTVHYLWTTYPVPTMVLAYTTLDDVEVNVNWTDLVNQTTRNTSVIFHPTVNYTFGFSMPVLYEYDDDGDDVDLNDNSYMAVHKFTESTQWKMELDESAGEVKFTANDSIIFKFAASTSDDRQSELPHQKYTAESNRFSLILDHVNVTTNKTRFAIEVNYVVQKGSTPDVYSEKNIDDEHTPAVFETVYGQVKGKHGKSYSQWKPIAYTKEDLGRKYQTKAVASSVEKVVNRSWNIGEVAIQPNHYQIYGLNVSFGITKDGFYQKNKYLVWSGIVGYGDPAKETLSFLVILIISIGLGLPLAIILFGGTYVQVRKRCFKVKVNTSYAAIN